MAARREEGGGRGRRGAEAEDAVVGRPREVRALHGDIHYWVQSAESLRLLSLAPFNPIPLSSIIPSSALRFVLR